MKKTKKTTYSPTFVDAIPEERSIFSWIIPPVILTGLTGLWYYPSLNYNFQFDDIANIHKFFNIRHLTFKDAWFLNQRWISYWISAINYRLGKFQPFYYRFFNMSFHIATGICIFFLTYLLLQRCKYSAFVQAQSAFIAYVCALLFLLHPVQTQTVSYVIQGRLEGLACFFMMLIATLFVITERFFSGVVKYIFYVLLLGLAFLACGTKEIMIVLPVLLFVIDWFFIAAGDWHDLKKRLVFHISMLAVILGVYLYFLKPSFFIELFGLKLQAPNNIGNVLTENPREKIFPLHYFISQFKVILHYMFIFIWPFSMSVEYDWKLVQRFLSLDCIIPLMILLGIIAYIAYRLTQNRIDLISFCALWFFIAIAPRSSIVPSSELLADYKTYSASYGIILLLSCGIVYLFHYMIPFLMKWSRTAIGTKHYASVQYTMITLLALPFGFSVYNRNKVWRSAEEFWRNIIVNAPGKARAYNNLAVAISEQNRIQESIPLYKKAIAMDKNYPDPCNNLAVAYSMTDKLNLAIDTLKQAIRMHPYYPEAYNNLASFYITKKEFDQAEKILQYALQIRPHYGKAYFNLGKLHLEKGEHTKALEYFKTACLKADLDNEQGFTIMANVAMHIKKYEDAVIAFGKLLELHPQSLDYWTKYANALLLNKEFEKALTCYEKLLMHEPHNQHHWYHKAEAHYQLGLYEQALEGFLKAEAYQLSSYQLSLRIADCMEKIGNKQQAQTRLATLSHDKMPASIKQYAQAIYAKL